MESGFPKAKYNKTLPVALVENAKEEKALGPGWYDHPNDAQAGRVLTDEERGGAKPTPHSPEKLAKMPDEDLRKKGFTEAQIEQMKHPAPVPKTEQ